MVTKKELNKENGIVVSDAIIAILIVLLFVGIITSLITNIILESAKIKLDSQHINIATEILEYIEQATYADIKEEDLINYINNINPDYVTAAKTIEELEGIEKLYKVAVNVEKYNDLLENEDKLDLIKIIEINIESNLDGETRQMQLSRIKKATMQEVKTLLEEEE